jgi:predicted transposase YbfD/YdcC
MDIGEDGDRKRKDHAPENLNVLRKGVIALLKDDYRSSLLRGN